MPAPATSRTGVAVGALGGPRSERLTERPGEGPRAALRRLQELGGHGGQANHAPTPTAYEAGYDLGHDEDTLPSIRPIIGEVLEPIRFGEFLREQALISDEQWLAALAEHWSDRGRRIGEIIAHRGYLTPMVIEQQARLYHQLDVVEVGE